TLEHAHLEPGAASARRLPGLVGFSDGGAPGGLLPRGGDYGATSTHPQPVPHGLVVDLAPVLARLTGELHPAEPGEHRLGAHEGAVLGGAIARPIFALEERQGELDVALEPQPLELHLVVKFDHALVDPAHVRGEQERAIAALDLVDVGEGGAI